MFRERQKFKIIKVMLGYRYRKCLIIPLFSGPSGPPFRLFVSHQRAKFSLIKTQLLLALIIALASRIMRDSTLGAAMRLNDWGDPLERIAP
jgi:hypothetical protein